MAAALGLEVTAHRMLESNSRAERALMTALAVSARKARRQLEREFRDRFWGGDDGG